jgi:two-component sensor histidine kinase/ligand-binding sensor domain-containing protein
MNAWLRFQFEIAVFFLIVSNSSFAQSNEFGETPDYTVQKEFISVEDGLAAREVYCVAQDLNGFIWFGTKFGLNRYDGKNFKLFTTKNGLSSNTVSNLFIDNYNRIIIQYGLQWSPSISTGKTDVLDPETFKVTSINEISKTSKWDKKNSWIYNYISKNEILRIKQLSPKDCNDGNLNLGLSSCLYKMPGNNAQLAIVDKEGLYYIKGNITVKLLNKADLFEGDNGRINYFFQDALDNIWICTPQGVYKIKFKRNYFHTFFTRLQQKTDPLPQARGIYVEINKNGIKTVYANLMSSIFSFSENLKHYNLTPTWGILAINNNIFSCGYNLYEFEKESLKFLRSNESISSNNELTYCLYKYSDSIIYLGGSNSIFAFNRFRLKSSVIQKNAVHIPTIKNVYRISNTSKGITAIAENGIYIIKNGKIIDYYGPQSKDKNKYIPIISIHDALEDKNGYLWIATNGEGLVQFDWNKIRQNQKNIYYTLNDGLPSMILYRIEEDASNNLWVSTDDGIFRFNKKTHQITKFKSKDGLPHNEFNRTSSFKSEDGWIYFGSVNGVVGFNPVDFELKKERQNIPFQIIGITKYTDNEEYTISWSLKNNNKSIEWLPSDRLIKIEFAALDYQSGKKKYAYRINGIQNEWIYTFDQSISIGSLPYGSHTIEIKAQLEDGTWLTNHLMIPINVIPPFYLQAWFIGLVSLLIISLVIIIIWYRSKLLKAQNSKLENLVTKRTEDLNSALGDKDVLMKELHHRVKNNLQIITGLLELQKAQMTDKKAIEALTEGQIRLSSIALIHQNFYGGTNLESISFKIFLTDLLIAVKQLFENEQRIIECVIQTDDIPIDINIAIPLGLIVNELLTNSYKYLPAEQLDKKIEINLTVSENGKYEFTYKDNGPGLPPNVNFENSQTLGLRLISGLSEQINGSLFYKYDGGSVFVIQFKAKSTK